MDLANNIDSKFRLAIIVARRAKQLINGAKPLVEIDAQNPLTIAIDEVNRGLVTMEMLDSVNIYLAESSEFQEEEESAEETADENELDLELTEENNKIEVAPEETVEPEEVEMKNPDQTETKE
ncbi:MAG: DNA-directed RNA polymerase subunit omega [Candidatus Aminicenantes bacterium]|nr:DNA-directed RNA polymerase subunit omega [Candidatus Aminicenantes bacterium]